MIHRTRTRRRLTLLATLLLAAASTTPSWAGSETPPEGPPWVRSLAEAQRLAVERDLPIFVYLTKTF
jgi:hypothetical protein